MRRRRKYLTFVLRKAKTEATDGTPNIKQTSTPTWRNEIKRGHELKHVLDSGVDTTIVPKVAIPGMKADKSKGGSFRIANGELLPNLGSTKLKGIGALSASAITIGTQAAEITNTFSSVDETVNKGMMVLMPCLGRVGKRPDIETMRIRDLVKGTQGQAGHSYLKSM